MLLMKMKLVAALLGASVSAARSGRYPMASRASEDVYSVMGVGPVPTVSCGISADRMEVELTPPDVRGYRWLRFYDRDGELEATCMVGLRREVTVPASHPIHRAIATTGAR